MNTFTRSRRRSLALANPGLWLLWGVLAVCLAAVGWRSVTSAQQPASAPGEFVIRSQTNVVLVDVRVWDKNGKPVTDLKQNDFHIWEDGKPQTISSFSLENVEKLTQATSGGEAPATIDLGKLPPGVSPASVLQDRRLLVLFFDLTSMPPDDLMRALKAAREFVRTRVTPADLVAAATYTSSLRIIQNFTNDRDALDKALKGILVGEQSSGLSAQGAVGEAGTTNASGEEVVTQDVSAAFTPDETEFNIFNTDEKLAAIESLARMLRDVPGRKSVIHFSSGLERTGTENEAQLRATTDAANRSNVSLYTVDARGLVALPPGGDASSASPTGTALYSGSAASSQISSLHGGRETLASLASDTGGRTFYDLNDLGTAFQEVQTENSSYYLLGYSPTDTRSDGRFRRLRVAVERAGVKVQARPGYFAPKDFRQFTREDKELQLQQAAELDTPFVDLPLVVETAYFRRPDNRLNVILAAKIPGSAISFLNKSGRHETEFDFVWRVTDPSHRVVGVLRDTLPVKLQSEGFEQVLSGNILYEGQIALPPGQYQLKALVRENATGKLGTFEQPLILPEITDNGLSLSSVVLSNESKEPSGAAGKRSCGNKEPSPLQIGSRLLLPSVTRVFRVNQTLAVYLESYGGRPASTANESANGPGGQQASAASGTVRPLPPSVAFAFFRGGRKFAEAGPYPGKLEKAAEQRATYFVQLPLEKFPPGRYTLQINVLDPALDRVAFARVPMAIVKSPPRPTVGGQGK
jgi:VWFA-related protein